MSVNFHIFDQYRKLSPNFITTDATGSYSVQLTPADQVNLVDTTLGVGTVILPPVGACAGLTFTIVVIAGTNAVTTNDYNNDMYGTFESAADLDAVGDRIAYYSDGFVWHKVGHKVA